MSLTASATPTTSLDRLLLGGLRALDITEEERQLAVRRYEELGAVLDERWASTRGRNRVFAQGSFRLGTVVRNVSREDDVDIDMVAMRDVVRQSISQQQLKDEVGDAVRAYAARPMSGGPRVEESSRCWTLIWPGMHMDVLPAIPDEEGSRGGLFITDRDVYRWLRSDPDGYARWFHRQEELVLVANSDVVESRLEVEQVPMWPRRSVLQRVVQALKRHRDVYFAHRPGEKPASVVITTLAAHAYAGGSELGVALRQVLSDMPRFLQQVDGEWVLPNPAQPEENFVDSWLGRPRCAESFFEWLSVAAGAVVCLESAPSLRATVMGLEEEFGHRFADGASRAFAATLTDARADGALRVAAGGLSQFSPGRPVSAGTRAVKNHRFAGGSTTA